MPQTDMPGPVPGAAGVAARGALSDYLAAERTLLAWIRTGLALMGFGFVVARFGLFIRELQVVEHGPGVWGSNGLSLWFGVALIGAGVVVTLISGWQHARLVRDLDRGAAPEARSSTLTAGVAVFLAVVGVAMAIYLVSFRSPAPTDSPRSPETSMAPAASNPAATPAASPAASPAPANNGISSILSHHSVDETVARLTALLQEKGVKLFAVVDHSGEAAKAGLAMPPTKLLIFGNPKAGTPLMLAAPSIAIDLPLKVLVAQDTAGNVSVSYNSPAYLQQRHMLPADLLQNIAVVQVLAAKAAE
jgi:uncharacterized protein (DUF302 family)/uncharacterized membrane protein YidH (DUF202 family)